MVGVDGPELSTIGVRFRRLEFWDQLAGEKAMGATYLQEQPGVAIPQMSCRLVVESMALERFLKTMQALGKVQSTNQNRIPLAALVWQCGKSLSTDPFDEFNESDLVRSLRDASAKLGDALPLERDSCISDNRGLLASAA